MTPAELKDALMGWRKSAPLLTDRDVLGDLVQPGDKFCDFVAGDDNYVWWHGLGEILKPRRVVEIGTRFGYSLHCLTHARPGVELTLFSFDAEVDHYPDGRKPLAVAEAWFAGLLADFRVVRADTRKMKTLGVFGCDVGVVDGDHSEAGCYHDMGLVHAAVNPGGWVVVDDTSPGPVRHGCERYCREHGLEWAYLPSLRGIHLVKVRETLWT